MRDFADTGVVLTKVSKDEYAYTEPGVPDRDGSFKFSLQKKDGKWHFYSLEFQDGGVGELFHIQGERTPYEVIVCRGSVQEVIESRMDRIDVTDRDATQQQMLDIAQAHPLSGGIYIEDDGVRTCICSAFTRNEFEEEATWLLDRRAEQTFLRSLTKHASNDDKRTRFLVAETSDEKVELHRLYGIEPCDDMDMIVEVEVGSSTDRQARLSPLGIFHLSKTPRFDYDSRTLTGVTRYQAINGHFGGHNDIWGAEAVMKRMPDEDIAPEDVRHYIGMALCGFDCDETPEPS